MLTEETEQPKKRKKASTSPTQRTLKAMRERGYFCAIVERWNSFTKQRVDLFGFVDVLCLGENEIIGVQATSGDNVSKRIAKIADHENVAAVRKAGIRILVHGWRKNAKGRYELREVDLS